MITALSRYRWCRSDIARIAAERSAWRDEDLCMLMSCNLSCSHIQLVRGAAGILLAAHSCNADDVGRGSWRLERGLDSAKRLVGSFDRAPQPASQNSVVSAGLRRGRFTLFRPCPPVRILQKPKGSVVVAETTEGNRSSGSSCGPCRV